MVRQDKGKEVEQALIGYHIALDKACTELAPQHMVQHLLSLARAFNSLYAQEQFIDETNKEKTAYYLMLTHGVQTILAHGLTTLGIEAPEVM
jgi:arginyl-tRNA synthetase